MEITKEDIVPQNSVKPIFMIAPVITAATAFIAMTAVPFFPEFELFGHTIRPIVADVNVGLLFILGVMATGLYGPLLAGMSSSNKWSLLGGARTAIQLLSYEVVTGLSVAAIVILISSLHSRLNNMLNASIFLTLPILSYVAPHTTFLALLMPS